jgi:hypothetical protein
VDSLIVSILEQVCEFSGPIHGLHLDLDHLRFICCNYMVNRPDIASGVDPDCGPEWICSAVTSFFARKTSLVLMDPMEYTAQVFLDNSKIFSQASAILNRQLVWIASEFARYSAPKHDLFKLVSITFLPLQKKVSLRWRHECRSELEIV